MTRYTIKSNEQICIDGHIRAFTVSTNDEPTIRRAIIASLTRGLVATIESE